MNVFYKRAIAQFNQLTVHRNQSLYLDDSATLHFSLYIPFHHNSNTVKKNCYSAIDSLPKFYTQETAIKEDEPVDRQNERENPIKEDELVDEKDERENEIDPLNETIEKKKTEADEAKEFRALLYHDIRHDLY